MWINHALGGVWVVVSALGLFMVLGKRDNHYRPLPNVIAIGLLSSTAAALFVNGQKIRSFKTPIKSIEV